MVNIEHRLTVDDLIVEYMIYRVKNGYEPSFITGEFISFLYYFESKYPVDDVIYENDKLFERFMERKRERNWSRSERVGFNDEKYFEPHMDMEKHPTYDDYIIKANYRLSEYDDSVINTYFMNEQEVKKIRDIIQTYFESEPKEPKRNLNMNIEVSKENLLIGKYITSQIISLIWNYYVNKKIENNAWPNQCRDIEKYLLNIDLANIIGLESIKDKLLELYTVVSKRIAIMYQEDKNLKVSSLINGYLAHYNYQLLIKDYEKLFEIAFSQYRSSLEIDMSKLSFTESHELGGIYNWDEDADIKTTTINIDNDNAKKLTRKLDTEIKNGGQN